MPPPPTTPASTVTFLLLLHLSQYNTLTGKITPCVLLQLLSNAWCPQHTLNFWSRLSLILLVFFMKKLGERGWPNNFTVRGFVSSIPKTEHFYLRQSTSIRDPVFQWLELPFSLQRYRTWNLNHEQTPRLLIFTSNDFVFQRSSSCHTPLTRMPFPLPGAFAFRSPRLSMLLNNNLLVYWCYHMKEKWCLHQEVCQRSKLSVNCIMLNQKIR